MAQDRLTRRGTLSVLSTLLALTLVPECALAASPALDTRRATTAALLRTAFPHDRLPSQFYAGAALVYLSEIDATPAGKAEHDRGLALLDRSRIAPFAELPTVIQRGLVAKIDQEPFFKALLWRGAELVYRDPRVWALVGYEGSAIEHGGYKDRGFDDIDWLPKAAAK